ncbi:hypothetical protein [Micromonospora tarensis]|uniref:Uncharacterized protein n=1 Tax=Micromonospora tarensis TaxID=2806100 RepID=A0ABS1YAQ6_9ACTN|nr:hypothetical protein [Micromonospora tarensis]MBM0274453.1 hypothetical protein [Micromonospora tarensis]
MKKQLAAILATTLGAGALILGAAAPASAAVGPPTATTPDGKTIAIREFVGGMYALLQPASAGDSAWTQRQGSTAQLGKVTATSDTAKLESTLVGPIFYAYRACAQTSGGVTCTAYYSPLGR